MNYYFIHHPEVAGIINAYTWLTGRMPMPPKWSLGYQQNRYSYYPEAEVMRIAETLGEADPGRRHYARHSLYGCL